MVNLHKNTRKKQGREGFLDQWETHLWPKVSR